MGEFPSTDGGFSGVEVRRVESKRLEDSLE